MKQPLCPRLRQLALDYVDAQFATLKQRVSPQVRESMALSIAEIPRPAHRCPECRV